MIFCKLATRTEVFKFERVEINLIVNKHNKLSYRVASDMIAFALISCQLIA